MFISHSNSKISTEAISQFFQLDCSIQQSYHVAGPVHGLQDARLVKPERFTDIG